MKFRGKIIELNAIQQFSKIVQTVAKLSKVVALRITNDHLYFIMTEQAASSQTNIWCEVKQANFFNEYLMEGLSKEKNEIYLELAIDVFVEVVKTAYNAKSLKIKLTKKQSPCLTLEVELPSLVNSWPLIHDIPISIIPCRLWNEYEEPKMSQFHVSIYMPSLKILKNIVDRLKNMSAFGILNASQNGEMSLKIDINGVMVQTHFKDLENPKEVNGHEISQRQMTWAEARVDLRKLNSFLSGQLINPTRAICNIVHKKMLHLFLLHEDVTLQYFLPAISL